MLQWNPDLYRRYEDERTRPAAELLARVPMATAARVIDLGCGPGNSTELLVRRFPGAHVVGIDNSQSMLDSAATRLPQVQFQFADICTWEPAAASDDAPELIYANAALQWVPDHAHLIPRLFAALAPGGALAIQMPDNLAQPSNRVMRELAGQPPWRDSIGDAGAARTELLSIDGYYDLLAREAASVDMWHTVYQHPMASAAAIIEWVRATALRPFVDPLPDTLRHSFLAEYERRIDALYVPRSDGRRLLAFPRLFMVAQRKP